MKVPLFNGFEATTNARVFFLNSLSTALLTVFTIMVKHQLDVHFSESISNLNRFLLTFMIAFISAYLTYWSLYILFGYNQNKA